jgi:hypothetical protein
MNKVISVILSLCLFTACQKHIAATTFSQFFITIDSTAGSLTATSSGDTFLVSLQNASMMGAVPVAYHLPTGATVSVGSKKNNLPFENIWADTVDVRYGNGYPVQVKLANGETKQYVLAFKYASDVIGYPEVARNATTNSIFFDGNILYAATSMGLLKSEYDGFTDYFLQGGNTGPGPNVNAAYVHGDTIYAGLDNGLAISTNGGRVFKVHEYNGQNGVGFGVSGIAVQGDTIYASTWYGLLVSRDRGATFDTTTNGLWRDNSPSLWCVYAKGSTVYAGGQAGLYISQDGGRSFTFDEALVAGGISSARVNDIYIQDGTMYLGTSRGLAVSTDDGKTFSISQPNGTTWVRRVSGNGGTITLATGQLNISTDNALSFMAYSKEIVFKDDITAVCMKGNVIYCGASNMVVKITPR